MPVWMILAPNPLAQGKRGAKRRRRIEPEIIASDRAAEIVDHDGQPWLRCRPVFPKKKNIELRVIGLPDGVWLRRFASINEIEAFTVRLVAPVGEGEGTFRQVTDHTIKRQQ